MANIDLLRTFLSVFRSGSFTRAAQELHLSQPAVSMHIRTLESQIGKPLFRRTPRGADPTAAGLELAQGASLHVDALEGLMGGTLDSGSIGESVHIGGPEEFLSLRVLPVLAPLIERGIHMRMLFHTDEPIMERMVDGEIDIAITTARWNRRGIEGEHLCHERLELVSSPAVAATIGDIPIGMKGAHKLRDVAVVSYDEQLPLLREWWQAIFGARPHLRAVAIANSLRATLLLTIAGAGITVLPSHVAVEALRDGRLVRLMQVDTPPYNELHLTWRAGALRSPSLASVHRRIRAAAHGW